MVVTNVLDGASRSAVNREDTLPGEYFPYGFKGALRAPGRCWQLGLDQRRATQALTPMRLSSRPAAGRRRAGARRAPCKGSHPPGDSALSRGRSPVKSAPPACSADGASATLETFHDSFGVYREDWSSVDSR